MTTIVVVVWATLLLSGTTVSAKRLRANPHRAKFSEPVDEEPQKPAQIDTDELNEKFSFPDPAAKNFKTSTPLESDRKVSVE